MKPSSKKEHSFTFGEFLGYPRTGHSEVEHELLDTQIPIIVKPELRAFLCQTNPHNNQ